MRTLSAALMCFLFVFSGYALAADSYDSLRAEYNKAEKGNFSRTDLINLGNRFYKLYSSAPSSVNADYTLLYAGKSYKLSYERHQNASDMNTAVKYFRIAYTNYDTPAAAEAYLESAEIFIMKKDLASAEFLLNRVQSKFPGSIQDMAAAAMISDLQIMAQKGGTGTVAVVSANSGNAGSSGSSPANQAVNDPISGIISGGGTSSVKAEGTALVTNIRYYSAKDYTRIVIDLSQNADFEQHWLNQDKSSNLPPRLFIDIFDSKVDASVAKDTVIKDGLVKSVRWAYNKPGVTRVVLDSEAIKDFTVFQMANPSRIVIDVSNDTLKTVTTGNISNIPATGTGKGTGTSKPPKDDVEQTLASAFGLKVRTIVIDPGHGGKDSGCYYNSLKESHIALDIALELRDLIQKNHKDITVYLTRDKDVFIPLEERTAIANKYKADLFISIHINAAKNTSAKGIETYVLNMTSDKDALALAAIENEATDKSMSDLQGILKDIMLSSKLEESMLLAGLVQNNLVSVLKLSKKENLGVKQAPFYVLIGAKMPSILVEAGFLSNSDDAKKLATMSHRKNIAKGIYEGIDNYIKKYNK